jgi:hypothetical protein
VISGDANQPRREPTETQSRALLKRKSSRTARFNQNKAEKMLKNLAKLNVTKSFIASQRRNISTTFRLNEIFKVQVRFRDFLQKFRDFLQKFRNSFDF